ncbi:MAG: hypothetical protein JXM70_07610, partial [Pirellulales bacterium]|nr:hypothetical protein [Pirellulales bacterium]
MNTDNQGSSTAPSEWYRLPVCFCLAAVLLCLLPRPVSAQVTGGPRRIRNVYIPADQLKLLFKNSSKGVLMPREKVLALWKAAGNRVRSINAPPADAVLTQAVYESQLANHELRVTGRIQIAKLRAGWQSVDLPFGGLAIESAQLEGKPARFGRKDDGTLFLALEKEGRFELELKMSAPLASKDGDLATTLKLPPVPASEMLIRLDKGKQLQLGETALQSDSSDNSRQVFRVAVDRTGLLPLVISDRFAGGNRAPLVLVNSRAIGHIEPAGLRWEINLDLNVYARAADSFQLRLPDSVDVAEVEAPQLSRWTIQEEADGTSLVTLTFRKPLLDRRTVRLLGLAPFPLTNEWCVPTTQVIEAASHVGQVSLYPTSSLRVDLGTLTGIRPERLPQAPAKDSSSNGKKPLAFAFWDANFKLPLRVIPRKRTVQASVATLIEVNRAGLVLRSSATVKPRYAPIFDIQIQLPRDWEVTSVLSANKPIEWESAPLKADSVPADAALQTVRFDLPKPLNPGELLEITLTAQRHPVAWLEQDDVFHELPLPDLRLVGADEVEGTVRVQAPVEIELLVTDLSDDLQPVAADGSRGVSDKTPGTALQYHYQDDARKTGRLRVRTKPAKVSAQTLAFVRLDRGKLDMHYQLDLNIRQGKIRQMQFTLPAAVGDKVQITPLDSPARVIEQRHTPLPDISGKDPKLHLWQIMLDRPVTGNMTLALDFGQTFSTQARGDGAPESETEASAATESGTSIAVPVLAMRNVSRQSGIVAVEAASDQQIDCEPEKLRDLDPADVLKPKAY